MKVKVDKMGEKPCERVNMEDITETDNATVCTGGIRPDTDLASPSTSDGIMCEPTYCRGISRDSDDDMEPVSA